MPFSTEMLMCLYECILYKKWLLPHRAFDVRDLPVAVWRFGDSSSLRDRVACEQVAHAK